MCANVKVCTVIYYYFFKLYNVGYKIRRHLTALVNN